MRIKAALAMAAIVAALFAVAPSHAATSAEYFGNTDTFPYAFCDKETVPGTGAGPGMVTHLNMGAVCVAVSPGHSAKITSVADDVQGANLSMSFQYVDANFVPVGVPYPTADPAGYLLNSSPTHGYACGTSPAVTAPAGAKYFYVFVHGPSLATLENCGPDTPYFGTHGHINITVT